MQLHKFSRFGSIGKPLSFFNFSAFFYSTYGMAVNCNELTENQARDLYNKKLGSHLLIENWSCFFTDIDIIDNCNGTPNKFQYEGGELMYGMNLNGIGSAGTGAFYHGKIINTAAYKRLYGSHGVQYIYGHYWQPDHNLDGLV